MAKKFFSLQCVCIIVSAIFIAQDNVLKAQTEQSALFEKGWGDCYNNALVYVDELPNGDYFMVGGKCLVPPPCNGQNYCCRMNSQGMLLWEKDWGNVYEPDGIAKVIKVHDGSYLLVGTGLSGAGGGVGDFEVTNIDADGIIRFHCFYDFYYNDGAVDVIETADSCFIISGWAGLTSSSFFPAFVKIDRAGNVIWKRKQQNLTGCAPGYMVKLSDGTFMVLGSAGNANSYYAHYATNGTMLSIAYPFGQTSVPDTTNRPRAIRSTAGGGFEILYGVGGYATNHPPYQVFTIYRKYAPDGQCISSQELGFHINFFKIKPQDSTFCGISTSSSYFEMQEDGSLKKIVGFATDDPDSLLKGFWYVAATRDGGYIGVGSWKPDISTAYPTFFAAKFAANGDYQPNTFDESIAAYPNPSMDGNFLISFDMLLDEKVTVRIVALDGRLVYTDEVYCQMNSHTDISVHLGANATAGDMYVLEVATPTARYARKLLVMRQ